MLPKTWKAIWWTSCSDCAWETIFTCFLILPDEFIDNRIDNVAITKNCQKGPRAARDSIHPWSGAFQFCANVLKHLLGVVQPGLETYHWISLWSNDPKRWPESAEAEGAHQCKNQVWGKFLPRFEDNTVDSRLLWPCAPIVNSVEMNGNGSPNQQPLLDMLQNDATANDLNR